MDESVRPEPRSAVMILVEASWKDQSGTLHTARARMENRSVSGACIRLNKPVGVGSRLRISWRWDDFYGITKYCRNEGKEYLVGLQREATNPPDSEKGAGARVSLRENESGARNAAAGVQVRASTKVLEARGTETAAGQGLRETTANGLDPAAASVFMAELAGSSTFSKSSQEAASTEAAVTPPSQEFSAFRLREPAATQSVKEPDSRKGRKHMGRKWLSNWGEKPEDEMDAGTNANTNPNNNGRSSNTMEPRKPSQEFASEERKAALVSGEGGGAFRAELLALEDIYREAGIVSPRKGYSINKVVDMLHSEHMRTLSKEAKRASVLMALDAAGISIDEVLDDAKARLHAIDTYEAGQRKQFEAEWARKAQENAQIQAELEVVKARFAERLKRNLDGVAREKATFGNWLTMKQQETQIMTEAIDLCLKPTSQEPQSNENPLPVSVADAMHKPV